MDFGGRRFHFGQPRKDAVSWAKGEAVRVAVEAEEQAEAEEEEQEQELEDLLRRRGHAEETEVLEQGSGGAGAADTSGGSGEGDRDPGFHAATTAEIEEATIPSVEERRALLEQACAGSAAEDDLRRPSEEQAEEEEEEFGVNWARMERVLGKEKVAALRAEKALLRAQEAAAARDAGGSAHFAYAWAAPPRTSDPPAEAQVRAEGPPAPQVLAPPAAPTPPPPSALPAAVAPPPTAPRVNQVEALWEPVQAAPAPPRYSYFKAPVPLPPQGLPLRGTLTGGQGAEPRQPAPPPVPPQAWLPPQPPPQPPPELPPELPKQPKADFLDLMTSWAGPDAGEPEDATEEGHGGGAEAARRQLRGEPGTEGTARAAPGSDNIFHFAREFQWAQHPGAAGGAQFERAAPPGAKEPAVARAGGAGEQPQEKEAVRQLSRERIREISARFPDSKAPAPPAEAARCWTELDLEIFLGSDGLFRPRSSTADQAHSSPLLAELQLLLAEEKVVRPPPEHLSLCHHLVDHRGRFEKLPVAALTIVPRAEKVPEPLRAPVQLVAKRGWRPRSWGLAFWCYESGSETCRLFNRYPPSSTDKRPAVSLEAPLEEFAQYAGVVSEMDPRCTEEHALAYPRFFVGGWKPFTAAGPGKALWEEDWESQRKLWAPPGVKDLSHRWVRKCASAFDVDFFEALASLDQLQFAPLGAVTRLSVENDSAHTWYGQIQGRRAFVLFSPQESPNLYPEVGEPRYGSEERRRVSPISVLHPNEKHFPKFRDSKAQLVVLQPGEMLVVPQGWWLQTYALEQSTTLVRRFWNRSNRAGVCDAFAQQFFQDGLDLEQRRLLEESLAEVREEVREDDTSGDEED